MRDFKNFGPYDSIAERLKNDISFVRYYSRFYRSNNLNIPNAGYNFIPMDTIIKVRKNTLLCCVLWNGGNIAIDTSGVAPYSDLYYNDTGYTYTKLNDVSNWRLYMRAVTTSMQKTNISQVYNTPGVYNISIKYDGSYINCYQEVQIIARKYI
jgi:hypothetical protein